MMKKNNFNALARLVVIIGCIAVALHLFFVFTHAPETDVVEYFSGTVAQKDQQGKHIVIFLDTVPGVDRDGDGNLRNDRDAWISTYSPAIAQQMSAMEKGDSLFAQVVWKADESKSDGINHYYVISLLSPDEFMRHLKE